MTNSTNQSLVLGPNSKPQKEIQYLLSSTYFMLMITGLFMNLLVIFVIAKKKLLRRTINYYICNMAVSDIILSCCGISVRFSMAVTNSNTWFITGIPGKITCKTVNFLDLVSTLVSTLSLVFMSLERFFAVVYPTKSSLRTCKVRKVLLVLTWFIPVLYYSKNFYSYKLIFGQCGEFWGFEHQQYAGTVLMNFYTVAFIIVPLVVLTVLYGFIVVTLHKRQAFDRNVIPTCQQRIRQKQRKRINILAFSIVLAFALCYGPMYFYVYIVHSFITKWNIDKSKDFNTIINLSYVFAFSNATINPLICIVFNREIRKAVKDMIPHCIRRPFRSQSFSFGMSSTKTFRSSGDLRSLDFDQRTTVTTSSIQRFEESNPI